MTQIVHRLPMIDKAIWKNAGDLDKPIAKQGRGRSSHCTIPDAVIAKMRHMHEVERMPAMQVIDAYPQHSRSYVRNVLGYVTRPHVRPCAGEAA
jgi:hypothetical protein